MDPDDRDMLLLAVLVIVMEVKAARRDVAKAVAILEDDPTLWEVVKERGFGKFIDRLIPW